MEIYSWKKKKKCNSNLKLIFETKTILGSFKNFFILSTFNASQRKKQNEKDKNNVHLSIRKTYNLKLKPLFKNETCN